MTTVSSLPGNIGATIERLAIESSGRPDIELRREAHTYVGQGLALTDSHLLHAHVYGFLGGTGTAIPLEDVVSIASATWGGALRVQIQYRLADGRVQDLHVHAYHSWWPAVEALLSQAQAMPALQDADLSGVMWQEPNRAEERATRLEQTYVLYRDDGWITLPRLRHYPRRESLLFSGAKRAVEKQLLSHERIVAEASCNAGIAIVLTDQGRFLEFKARGLGMAVGEMPTVEVTSLSEVKEFRTQAGVHGLKLIVDVAGKEVESPPTLPYYSDETRTFTDKFVKLIHEAVAAAKASSGALGSRSPLDELEKLDGLRKAGLLSDDEWEAGKKRLLERL